jgi:riboflavin synthase
MFTGIVTQRGRVERVERRADGAARLVLSPEHAFDGLADGASVAVDGVCLTVVSQDGGRLAFDVVPETLRRTTLGERGAGERVNLERALRVGDELGGHWVQGHVDGVGEVTSVERRGGDVRLAVTLPPALEGAAVAKGSVTLDGVSLTVGEVWRAGDREALSVYLIPHTLANTGLAERVSGTRVNVEADPLGRWVKRLLGPLPASPRH